MCPWSLISGVLLRKLHTQFNHLRRNDDGSLFVVHSHMERFSSSSFHIVFGDLLYKEAILPKEAIALRNQDVGSRIQKNAKDVLFVHFIKKVSNFGDQFYWANGITFTATELGIIKGIGSEARSFSI